MDDLWYAEALTLSYAEASLSQDPSTQLGAVLLSPDRLIIGVGNNHFPTGTSDEFWHGPKEAKYERVAHAELSAILDASKKGFSTKGSTLVCPWASCSNCAKYMVEAGVSTLVRHIETDPHSAWTDSIAVGDEIMRSGGVHIIEVPGIPTDIQLRRGGKPWLW
jgi:dCMP deaminase